MVQAEDQEEPMDNTLRFWGVRGSLPAPGAGTIGVGGNTSCVEVNLGGQRFIIDGGTGLRALGAAQGGRPLEATMLFSHMHWDHIQGIPFFSSLYHPKSRLTIYGPAGLEEALKTQMSSPTFPVGMDVMGADITFMTVKAGDRFEIEGVEVRTAELNHPGGSIGYRLSCNGKGVVYLCDHEQGTEPVGESILDLVQGADILIADAQYTPEEYSTKVGWGHSTYEQAAHIALAGRVGRLLLTHHEPLRGDSAVADLERRAQDVFEATAAAREGNVIMVSDDETCVGSSEIESKEHHSSPPTA